LRNATENCLLAYAFLVYVPNELQQKPVPKKTVQGSRLSVQDFNVKHTPEDKRFFMRYRVRHKVREGLLREWAIGQSEIV
jgi:hypothetical protein